MIPTRFGLDARPPWPATLLAAVQHLLAIAVSIATAPLVISLGMGLGAADTQYMISSALVVSGVATLIQVGRPGPFGSGLLSVQGTSFAFVGPLIYLASRQADGPDPAFLGDLFGSAAVGAVVVMIASRFLHRLERIVTPTVAGCAVLVIGISLVGVTAENLWRTHEAALATDAGPLRHWLVTTVAVVAILGALRFGPPWLRVASIFCGLLAGLGAALALGLVPTLPEDSAGPTLFLLDPLRFGIGVDASMLAVLLPIYLVSAVESIGDLTATSSLSGLPVRGPSYWERVRGGVLGDGLNSLLAALCATFPNTTFSQNNGVIRLTGVASRRVGLVLGALLVVVGTVPAVAQGFLALPSALVNGLTLVMFAMVAVAGIAILAEQGGNRRATIVGASTVVASMTLAHFAPGWDGVPEVLRALLGTPVASAVPIAIVLDRLVPPLTESAAADA